MKNLLYILVIATGFSSIAQNDALFSQANELYNSGNYQEAIAKYENILNSGVQSAEVYFNLGNANYKLNNIAPSVYYYEKALLLAPDDKDIKNNLAFAQNMTVDAIEDVPEIGLSKFFKSAINIFTYEGWARLSIALMVLFVGLFLLYYFSFRTQKKRWSFITSIVSLFLMFVSLAFAFQKYSLTKSDKPAIVFSQEAEVKSEPNLRSTEAFKLHEGTKIKILDTVNNWKKIKLADGKIGWILNDDIKAL